MLLSILVFVVASLLFACSLSVPVSVSYVIADSTHLLYALRQSLQADCNGAFEEITEFGVCRLACHDYLLCLFVLVTFLEDAVLSQLSVAFDIFHQHIGNVYWGILYNNHLCLCDVHLQTHFVFVLNQYKFLLEWQTGATGDNGGVELFVDQTRAETQHREDGSAAHRPPNGRAGHRAGGK